MAIHDELAQLLPVIRQVYDITFRHEIEGELVPNNEKIFSIFEQHTDILVKGRRKVEFGHKINLCSGASNLILDCKVLKGNPSDKELFEPMLDTIIGVYKTTPRDSATDGGYASLENQKRAQSKGIMNIVFNKIVGSLQNVVSSSNMETRLKKWRSGIEAVISNIKRGYHIARCNWKGWEHYVAKVMWSIIAYNIRVMTLALLSYSKA